MFTWIIEHKAKILDIKDGSFTVENKFWTDLQIGQSIAHDGACMTLTAFDSEKYTFFAMWESLEKTNFLAKKKWDYFNVERCLQIGQRLDWHFVSGHVDTVWKVSKLLNNEDGSREIFIFYPSEFTQNLIPKGSITINWTSLTLCHLSNTEFSVSLIPLTLEITNLWDLIPWDSVNLEFDMLWKYILNTKK